MRTVMAGTAITVIIMAGIAGIITAGATTTITIATK
jgi:hypothetical protein